MQGSRNFEVFKLAQLAEVRRFRQLRHFEFGQPLRPLGRRYRHATGQAAADVVAMIIGTADDEDDVGGGDDDAGGDDAILPMEDMKTVANGIRPIRVADFFPARAMFEAPVKRRCPFRKTKSDSIDGEVRPKRRS
jgi:hypothetical protein